MKSLRTAILFFICLFFANTAFAQYGIMADMASKMKPVVQVTSNSLQVTTRLDASILRRSVAVTLDRHDTPIIPNTHSSHLELQNVPPGSYQVGELNIPFSENFGAKVVSYAKAPPFDPKRVIIEENQRDYAVVGGLGGKIGEWDYIITPILNLRRVRGVANLVRRTIEGGGSVTFLKKSKRPNRLEPVELARIAP